MTPETIEHVKQIVAHGYDEAPNMIEKSSTTKTKTAKTYTISGMKNTMQTHSARSCEQSQNVT